AAGDKDVRNRNQPFPSPRVGNRVMSERSCLSIILAAGEGTRMKSALPKVLHPVASRPMIAHVAQAAVGAGVDDLALVVGRRGDAVLAAVAPVAASAETFEQKERLGT